MTISSARSLPPAIGALVHRFGLESPVRTPDGSGGFAVAYALASEVWGSLEALDGREASVDGRLAATLTHSVWLRWRDGLAPDMRLRLGTRVFQIRAILDRDGRHRFLECRCEETVT